MKHTVDTTSKFIYQDGNKYDCFIIYKNTNYVLTNNKTITIPKGFETDFASIPRFLWSVFPPHWKPYREAAIVHDYLYMNKTIISSRAFADAEFRRILIRNKVNIFIAWLFWLNVRIFGGKRFKNYKNGRINIRTSNSNS